MQSTVYHKLRPVLAAAALLPVVSGMASAADSVSNWIANGDFTANAAAFTASPGYAGGGGNPAGIASWGVYGAGSSVGLNGAKTGAGVGNTFGPTNQGGRTYAFIQSVQTLLGQYLTLAPGTQYKLDFDVASRAGNTAQYRVVIAPSDTTGFTGLY